MPQAPAPAVIEKTEAELRREENVEAVIGAEEDGVVERGETDPPRQGQDGDPDDTGVVRREPIARSPSDDIRSNIAARFRRAEPEDERPFNGNINDPENQYGEVGREPAVDDDDEIDTPEEIAALTGQDPPARAPQRQDQPRMITRKVRGKDVTLSEDEWLDRAAQVTAADSYLAEAREMLAAAKEIKAGTSPDRQHPDGPDRAQTDGLDNDPEADAQHPEPTFRDVVEQIQYGDPDAAAEALEKLVDKRAGKKASEGALNRAYNQDLARSQKALKTFREANPELDSDEIAAIAIERGMYRLYREDIVKLGIDEAQLPTIPAQLANWHRFYRINGYEVSDTPTLLNKSKEQFLKWRGGQQAPSKGQQQQSRQGAPRVEINVNRDQRRAAIPNHPNRGVTPRRDVQTPRVTTGSDVVANMRRQRGQI
jgi:hypothetical protein